MSKGDAGINDQIGCWWPVKPKFSPEPCREQLLIVQQSWPLFNTGESFSLFIDVDFWAKLAPFHVFLLF